MIAELDGRQLKRVLAAVGAWPRSTRSAYLVWRTHGSQVQIVAVHHGQTVVRATCAAEVQQAGQAYLHTEDVLVWAKRLTARDQRVEVEAGGAGVQVRWAHTTMQFQQQPPVEWPEHDEDAQPSQTIMTLPSEAVSLLLDWLPAIEQRRSAYACVSHVLAVANPQQVQCVVTDGQQLACVSWAGPTDACAATSLCLPRVVWNQVDRLGCPGQQVRWSQTPNRVQIHMGPSNYGSAIHTPRIEPSPFPSWTAITHLLRTEHCTGGVEVSCNCLLEAVRGVRADASIMLQSWQDTLKVVAEDNVTQTRVEIPAAIVGGAAPTHPLWVKQAYLGTALQHLPRRGRIRLLWGAPEDRLHLLAAQDDGVVSAHHLIMSIRGR